jgi:hypothetical protein
MLLVGTTAGLYEVDGGEPRRVLDRAVTCLSGRWAVADGRAVLARSEASGAGAAWADVAAVGDGLRAYCLAASPAGDEVLVGTSEAHVLRLPAGGGLAPDPSFDAIPTRDEWYTPWGAPPDTRSLAVAGDGTAFVNVHVGGVWRSTGGAWDERVEVDADTHQVVAADGVVLVAAAVGFGMSTDGGETFDWSTDGLHDTYARAVALAGDTVLLTASTGPSTSRGAVYRRALDGGPFEKAHAGLPEWFPSNVDTHCLAASGSTAAFGTGGGDVWVSTDAGRSWELAASGLGTVRCVALA